MTNKLHIAHVIYRFDTGGLENGVVNIINRLGEDDFQHSIVTLCGRGEAFCQRITTQNVEFYDLAKQPGQDWGMFVRLNRLLKQLNPDVLHTRNTATLECQVIGWWRGVTRRIHGEHGWDVNDLGGANKKYRLLRRLIKPFVQHYVALSSEALLYLQRYIGVKADKISHICNGVDAEKFAPAQTMQTEKVIIGCVGRMEAVKNQQLLVKAVALASQQSLPSFEVRLVGDGSYANAIKSQIEALNISDKVVMLGNRSDVHRQMQEFDVFVLPSLAEGISNTVLEAMACGLPVIATDVGGNPDLVKDKYNGYLVSSDDAQQMADKIASYVQDADLRRSHGQHSRARVEKEFSLTVMVDKYRDLYRSLHASSQS